MNLVDQLWTLQQIYRNENAYYDREQDMHLHRIPANLPADRLEALPNQLSGGQQQRAAIARSLIYRPALLLADEPTGNLDRKNSREIMDLLKLSNRNLEQTIILITHDEKAALEADRIITIEDGRIIHDERRR